MKIYANTIPNNYSISKAKPKDEIKHNEQQTQKKSNQYITSNFLKARGINFTSNNLVENINDYNWFINHDKLSPVDSLLKIEGKPEAVNDLLTTILKDDKLNKNFIESLTRTPRETDKNFININTKINDAPTLLSFLPNSPYKKAYDEFLENKVNTARSIEGLLKIRPDWKEDILINKYEELKGNRDFQIGNIPKEFPENSFGEITNYLKGHMQYGYKAQKQIPEYYYGNTRYDFEYFTDGKSDKNVFGVYTQGKRFIFKIGDKENRGLNKPNAIGTLALIDNYLTLHRCRNSAPICYYNHECNTSIYKYIDHNHVDKKFENPNDINKHLPDFANLGMYYNDTIGVNNYFKLSDNDLELWDKDYGIKNQELISVDNDHVTYSSILNPKVEKYNIDLPNGMQGTI